MISKSEESLGKRTITIYRPAQKGIEFCRDILEPYEKMFPRRKNIDKNKTETSLLIFV